MSHWFSTSDRSADVSNEYTKASQYLDTLPVPYDSTRRIFKTTRLINSNGSIATNSDGTSRGYSDYMSYDSHGNQVVSFNHYTPFSTKQIQETTLNSPSLQGLNGKWSAYKWDEISKEYVESFDEFSSLIQEPLKTGVDIATIIGTISNESSGQYLYPLTFNRYGNVYAFNDTLNATEYNKTQFPFYIKVSYLDGSIQYESINITPKDGVRPFGLNIALEDRVNKVELYKDSILIQAINIPTQVPEDTPITYFMGKGVNEITGNVNLEFECFDDICNQKSVGPWKYKVEDGSLDIEVVDALMTHFKGYSVITLDNNLEIKAYRFKSNTPSITRSLDMQPTEWSLTDEENIKFEFLLNDSSPQPSSRTMVKVKDSSGDRKTESFIIYTNKRNDIADNVALNKPTSQLTNYRSDDSDNLVDGNIDTYNHTGCIVGDWAEVDLEYKFDLTKLKLTHRNSWMSRMNGSKIIALNEDRKEVWSTTVSGSYVWEYESGLKTDGFDGRNIRYIRIENDDCIHWGEIEAYIDPIYN